MIVYVFLTAFLISIFTKRIRFVVERNYKYFYLFPVPFILQMFPFARNVFMPLSFLLLLILLILNKHIPGFSLITIGTALNSFVMMINGWKMPVLKYWVERFNLPVDLRHVVVDSFSWKVLLGDWIPIVLPWKDYYVISIGDIFVYIGIFYFLLKISDGGK